MRHLTRSHWNSENLPNSLKKKYPQAECDPRLPALERRELGIEQRNSLAYIKTLKPLKHGCNNHLEKKLGHMVMEILFLFFKLSILHLK